MNDDIQSFPDTAPIANSIQKAVSSAMAAVPPERSGALFFVATPTDTHLVFAARIGDHVQIATTVGVDAHRHIDGAIAAQVVF